LKIIVVNNYKELSQAERAVQNIEKCTGQSVEKIDYKERDLHTRVVESEPDLVILTGSSALLSKPRTRELTKIPDEFRHLAQSKTSKVEAMVHQSKPIYGVQFHPERSNDNHPHGKMIIQNLLKQIRGA